MNSLGWLGGGMAPIAVAFALHHHTTLSACISATAAIYLLLGLAALLLTHKLSPRASL